MKICPQCKRKRSDYYIRCPYCGTEKSACHAPDTSSAAPDNDDSFFDTMAGIAAADSIFSSTPVPDATGDSGFGGFSGGDSCGGGASSDF